MGITKGKSAALIALAVILLSFAITNVPLAYAHEYKQIPLKINVVGKEVGGKWEGATITPEDAKKKIDEVNKVYKQWGIEFTPEVDKDGKIKINKVDDPEKQAGTDWGEVTRKDRNTLKDNALKNEIKNKGFKLFFVKRILTPVDKADDNDITDQNSNGVSRLCNPVAFVEPEHDEATKHTIAHEFVHGLGVGDSRDADGDGTPNEEEDREYLNWPTDRLKNTNIPRKLTQPNIDQIKKKAEERGDKKHNAEQGARKDHSTTPTIVDVLNDAPFTYLDIYEVSWFTSTDLTEGAVRMYLAGNIPADAVDLRYYTGFDIDGDDLAGATFGPLAGIERKLVVQKSISGWSANLLNAITDEVLVANLTVIITQSWEASQMEEGYPQPTPFEVTDIIYVNLPTQYLQPLAGTLRFGALTDDPAIVGYEDYTVMEQFSRITGPTLDLSSLVGSPGSLVTASGSFFAPMTTVHLFFELQWIKSVVTDDQGTFSTTFTIPYAPPGDYYIDAIDTADNTQFSIYTVTTLPIGGYSVPIDKPKLDPSAPYIGLALTILVGTAATATYVKRVNRRKRKQ